MCVHNRAPAWQTRLSAEKTLPNWQKDVHCFGFTFPKRISLKTEKKIKLFVWMSFNRIITNHSLIRWGGIFFLWHPLLTAQMSQGESGSWLIHTQSSFCTDLTVFPYLVHSWLLSFCYAVLSRNEGCHTPAENCCAYDISQKQSHGADHCSQPCRKRESNP